MARGVLPARNLQAPSKVGAIHLIGENRIGILPDNRVGRPNAGRLVLLVAAVMALDWLAHFL